MPGTTPVAWYRVDETYTVQGVARDTLGDPWPAANILLKQNGVTVQTVALSSGVFAFTGVFAGNNYTLDIAGTVVNSAGTFSVTGDLNLGTVTFQ